MTIETARKRMAAALSSDPELRQGYVANLACLLYDNQRTSSVKENLKKMDGASRMAERILKLVFD